MKTWLPWIIIGIMLLGCGYMLDRAHTQGKLLEARLEASDARNAQLAKDASAAAERAVASEKREAELAAQAEKREALLLDALARVRTATPQQLVDDGSRLLGASDITTNGATVMMGLETWRSAVRLMVLGNEYETTAKPAWAEQIKGWAETKAALRSEIDARIAREASLEKTVRELSSALGSEKRSSTFEKALWTLAGVGLGMAVNQITK